MAETPETIDQPLPELPDPAFAPPDAQAALPPEPEESEQIEESEPPPPPVENREAMLARENAQLRDLLTNIQQQQVRQPPQYAPSQPEDPYAPFLRGIDPAQQPAWRESLKVLNPVVQHLIHQATAPLQEQLRVTQSYAESAALAQERNPQTGDVMFPDYPQLAAQCEQARYQEYQKTGIWHPLRLVYLVMKGAGVVGQPSAQQQAKQERTRSRRAQAARVPVATTAEPQQGTRMPAPRRTVEGTMAMSDEEMRALATKNGIEWPGQPTRKRVA